MTRISPLRALSQLINRKPSLLAMCILALGIVLASPVTSSALVSHPLFIDFISQRETSGNGNGIVEPGESGEMKFVVTNYSDRMVGARQVDVEDPSYTLDITDYYFVGGTGSVFASYEDKYFYVQFDVPSVNVPPGECSNDYDVNVSVAMHWVFLSPYNGQGLDRGSGTVSIASICTPCTNINTKTFNYSGPSTAIPDEDETGVDLYLDVDGAFTINDLEFIIAGSSCTSTPGAPNVGLDHANVHDLILTLTSPSGTTVTLMNRPGDSANAGSNFCNLVLDDNQLNPLIQSITTGGAPYSGTFAPANPLSAFYGEDPNGTWVLNVSDHAAGNTGQVRAFSLLIEDDSEDCYQDVFPGIGGRVTTDGTTPVSDVMMKLTGARTYTSSTQVDGYYTLGQWDLHSGSYTVTPHKLGYIFNPVSRYLSVLDTDSVADFIATEANFSISGRVTIAGTTIGLSGATVTLQGDRATSVTTGADGTYTFPDLPAGGNYTVTPFMIGYRFTPTTGSYSNLIANQTNQNFAARMQNYSVGGVVRLGTAGLGGVTVTLSSPTPDGFSTQTATTSSNGGYSFTGLPSGRNYTVTATKAGYQLIPASNTLTNLSANQTKVNFAVKVYSLSGAVRLGTNGLGGVSLTLTSPTLAGFTSQTVLTSSTGAYSFTNVPAGSDYTVTPQKTGYRFTQASRTLTNLSANHTAVNFFVEVYSISGRITRTGTTTGINAVTVTMGSPTPAGFPARTAQTNNVGNYTFTNLPAGRNYTIKPAKSGFTFSPATRSITNLSGNIPAGASTNFTGTGP